MKLHSFYTCPMNAFIEIICEASKEALQLLILSGEPSDIELVQAWQGIVEKYTEKVSTPEQRMYLALYKAVTIQQLTLKQIAALLECMREKKIYAEELGAELNRLCNSSFPFDPEGDPEGYFKMLDGAEVRSKGILLDLKLKEATLKAMEDKQKKGAGEPCDRDYFVKLKITLEEVFEIGQFNYDTLTVSEYCERLNRAVQKSKALEHARGSHK